MMRSGKSVGTEADVFYLGSTAQGVENEQGF